MGRVETEWNTHTETERDRVRDTESGMETDRVGRADLGERLGGFSLFKRGLNLDERGRK